MAFYIGNVIDVGVEILAMKSLQEEMASGVGYYEGELYNLVREGRGVPAAPLVLIGVVPCVISNPEAGRRRALLKADIKHST